MLAAIDIRISPNSDCTLPHPCAHMLHAALLDLVREGDPDASRTLHEDCQSKPFSVSTLLSEGMGKGNSISIPQRTECRFRLCTLGKPVLEAFSKPIFSRVSQGGTLRLGSHDFSLLEAGMTGPYGGISTFGELLSQCRKAALLHFDSPVTFRRRGLNVPLPDPQLVYGSLWQKWLAFSDAQVAGSVFDEMIGALGLSGMNGSTHVWKYPHHMQNGFVGSAQFELVRPVSEQASRLFNALSRLSFFTGVGYRTTMGMGQCRLGESGTS